MLEKLKGLLKTAFSTEFLLKLLIIAVIALVLEVTNGGFRIYINHYHSSGYGGFEVKMKE